jgi:hypothetical protein
MSGFELFAPNDSNLDGSAIWQRWFESGAGRAGGFPVHGILVVFRRNLIRRPIRTQVGTGKMSGTDLVWVRIATTDLFSARLLVAQG